MDNEFGNGRIQIAPPLPEQDLGAAYAQSFDSRQAADDDAWFKEMLGETATPPTDQTGQNGAGGGNGDLPSASDLFADDTASGQGGGDQNGGGQQQPAPSTDQEVSLFTDIATKLGAVAGDMGGGIVEAPRQVVGGVIDAITEAGNVMESLIPTPALQITDPVTGEFDPKFLSPEELKAFQEAGGQDILQAITPNEADTRTGAFVRSTSQFLAGFLPATRAVKAIGITGALANSTVAGFIADAVVFDPHEDRLSTFLNEVPGLGAIVPDYLADNNPENEGEWEGRMKNAIEGLGLGLAAEGLMRAFKYYKLARRQRAARLAADAGSVQETVARDAIKQAARTDIVENVTDDQLRALGDTNAPLVIGAADNETAPEAFRRMAEARTRVEVQAQQVDAIGKISDAMKRFQPQAGRDPFDEMLDALRSGTGAKTKLPKRPATSILRDLGGIDPQSSIAGELRSRGITAKTHPGLFRKNGLKSLDNIPASEHEIFVLRNAAGPDGYIPEQSWIDALDSETRGEPWLTAAQEETAANIIAPIDELDAELSRLNIDYDNMSNSAVRQRLMEIEDEAARFEASRQAPQGGRAQDLGDVTEQNTDMIAARAYDAEGKPVTPTGKIYINHARINSADDVRSVLQELADMDASAIDAKRRGKVTNAQTIKESSKEFTDLNDLIGRAPGPMTASQATAARRLLTSSGEQIVDLARRAAMPEATKADIYNFRRAMAVHYAIQSEVIAARTETARALQAWSIPVGATRARSEAINELVQMGGGAGDLQALAKAVATVGDNPTAINTMARELGKGRIGKALYQVWVNGLLSSPKTHVVNITSNSMVAAYAIPERYLSGQISKVFYNGEIQTGEAAAQAYGLVKGIRDGFRLAYHGNKAEGMEGLADVFDAFVKMDNIHGNAISADAFGLKPEGGLGYGIDLLGKAVNAPGTLLELEDRFFKSIGYRMELQAQAYRSAAAEGLEGKAFAQRVADILANPPENLVADALDVAHYQTFTNPLGKTGKAAQQALAKIPGARLVVPFVRTPTNIVKYTFERTPLAYMSGRIRADIAAGGARAAQAHARVALGSMIMLTIMDMATEGSVTGRGPVDSRLRGVKMNEGWMPYSVKIGDRWYQYSRTDPIGMMIGLGADISEILANADQEQTDLVVTAGIVALANNLANKTYMSGIYDFIGAIDPSNPTNDPGKYLADFSGSMVPYSSFLRNVTYASDPIVRETRTAVYGKEGEIDEVASYLETLVNQTKKAIPGLSDELPPRRDLWGEEITRASGLGWGYDFISPISSRADNPDPVDRAILDNRVMVSAAPRSINGVRLTAEQYSEFVREAGEPAKKFLDDMVSSPGFKRMSDGPDGMKAEVIKDAINTFRDRARQVMILKYPDLRQKAFMLDKRKAELLTAQPEEASQ